MIRMARARFGGMGLAIGSALGLIASPVAAQVLVAQDPLDEYEPRVSVPPVFEQNEVVQDDPREPAIQSWSVDNAATLATVIEGIGSEGLDPADYQLRDLREAIALGAGPALDEQASRAFTWLVEDLRDGRTPMSSRRQWFVVDPDVDLMPTAQLMTEVLATGDIASIVEQLTPVHEDYATLRQALAETPAADVETTRMIRANMDRWRWLPRDLGTQYLLTNVPEYQLRLMVNGQIIRTYRTVVGKPGRTATPQLAETVEGVIFNPTWTVPQSIVVGEGLGNRVLNNPSWARANGYRATRGADGFTTVVQQPGPGNSLGMMKLDMPNPHAIFLHDTPAKALFDSDDRARSHGCIRVERALELAMTVAILGGGATRDEAVQVSRSGEYTRVPVERTLPVYITYFTYGVDVDGNLREFDDIYGRDEPVLASLDAPRVGNRAHFSTEEVVPIERPGA
ncbi:L,D-transpeptidase family protein [Aurantiacibacter poecillastricola]|uniref:L,D-transpeptidase family protein n=1 Tax=Aurantiacibacter poecillastricola TaxID=3064385 RepID=UPI00273E76E7|nr:L,D-transpeptidase family protein [Aurantiacibacter sp. 219JJ12-13]MDP5261076.1 L,D-transpeptidase family protein [Aurantiacibacter sp. 219JJ12-13]